MSGSEPPCQSTAEQSIDRHGKAPLNRAKTAMVKTAEQGKAPLNRAKNAMVKTAEQGKAPLNRAKTAMVKTAEQGRHRVGAVLTGIFCAYVAVGRRGAGRQGQVGFVVPAPWSRRSSWSV
ncbi:hypothetical protein NDU88_002985 [Pleurodeles waltl]|uniref:Uncharacterized protein n=1 Tax=Pleurodeles waltl TaxID=8319 RepID=A0AAV7V0F4_PLEWA|nr:hypothetical protein NDU88_002985 [Pleurodeles waltl]